MDPLLVAETLASLLVGAYALLSSLPVVVWLCMGFLVAAGLLDRLLDTSTAAVTTGGDASGPG